MPQSPKSKPKKLNLIDKWILNKLNTVIKDSTDYFENYDYSHTKMNTEIFFWQVFCDNYLEMVKHRFYETKDKSALYTLYTVLLDILKLFAPIIPHITEELYQDIFRKHEKEESIHKSAWPKPRKEIADRDAERMGDLAREVIVALRQYKSLNKMPLNTPLKEVVIECKPKARKDIEKVTDTIKGTSKIGNISFGKADMISTENVKMNVNQ